MGVLPSGADRGVYVALRPRGFWGEVDGRRGVVSGVRLKATAGQEETIGGPAAVWPEDDDEARISILEMGVKISKI